MTERFMKWVAFFGFVILGLVPATSHASGFALFEQGSKGMGFAGAFTAQANDPSAIFHNVAGIAFLKGTQVYVGGTGIKSSATFTGADPFPGAGISETGDAGFLVPPHAYVTQQLSQSLVVGVGVDVPFGLRTGWLNADTTYSGRFISRKAQLNGVSVNPSVAFKLADRLSVGGGVDIRFSSVELDRNVAGIQPFTLKAVDIAAVQLKSDTKRAVGFNLGVIAKPTEALSIGASYRHTVTINYTGSAVFTQISTGNASVDALVSRQLPIGSTPVTTSIEFPSELSGGVAYTWNDWTIEGDVNWYKWSTFQSLPVTFVNRPDLSSVIPEEYSNSLQFRGGIERHINETWTVRGGYYRDNNPSPDASVSPLLPDANRNGVAVGATYRKGRLHLDAANLLVFFNARSTNGVNRDQYNGTYKNFAEVFSVSLGYGF
jgi:long-chain fatty acid transport protein